MLPFLLQPRHLFLFFFQNKRKCLFLLTAPFAKSPFCIALFPNFQHSKIFGSLARNSSQRCHGLVMSPVYDSRCQHVVVSTLTTDLIFWREALARCRRPEIWFFEKGVSMQFIVEITPKLEGGHKIFPPYRSKFEASEPHTAVHWALMDFRGRFWQFFDSFAVSVSWKDS